MTIIPPLHILNVLFILKLTSSFLYHPLSLSNPFSRHLSPPPLHSTPPSSSPNDPLPSGDNTIFFSSLKSRIKGLKNTKETLRKSYLTGKLNIRKEAS